MERAIELILDQFLKEVCGEGGRRIKLQAFSASLAAIQGIRKLFLLMYLVCFTCFLCALSLFAAGYVAAENWRAAGQIDFHDPRLVFSVIVWLLSTTLLAMTVRERKWSGAFRLQERIAELERESRASGGSGGLSEADLVRIIDRVLDDRLSRERSRDAAA